MIVKIYAKEKNNYNIKILSLFDYNIIYELIYNLTFNYKITKSYIS